MTDITANDTATAFTQQIIKQVINAWAAQSKNITTFFNKYDNEAYLQEVAPGRNRAVYLLGHLIASSDGMLAMFELGDRFYPELEEIFSKNPDKHFDEIPTADQLKQYWETLNTTLSNHFTRMQPEQWLERHNRVSAEDFAIDPLRNKLNVLIGRTNHIAYHMGQLTFLNR